VLTILRIHGSGFGVPHPGLLPNAKEREAARAAIAAAIAALEAHKVEARGEIAVTRAETRAIARAARASGAATVILDLPEARGLRRLIEGDLAAHLRRRLGPDVIVLRPDRSSGGRVRTAGDLRADRHQTCSPPT
jgi:hypothetical protein